MNNLRYQICLTKGREIFLIISLTYCNYHFLYSSITPSNIYPINSKTTNSEKAKSQKIIIHSISNHTKFLTSKSELTIYRNFQFVNWFFGRWNELCKSIYQKSSVAKLIGNLLK